MCVCVGVHMCLDVHCVCVCVCGGRWVVGGCMCVVMRVCGYVCGEEEGVKVAFGCGYVRVNILGRGCKC